MSSLRTLIPRLAARLGAGGTRYCATTGTTVQARSVSGVAAQNPHLSDLPADYLYHLGLSDDRSGELEVN